MIRLFVSGSLLFGLAEVEVTESGLRSTERGFDGQGLQLFGTEPGVFIELRCVERQAPP